MSAHARIARALRPHAVAIALALIAIGVAWSFAATTLRATPELGLPLDDSYIYLTYAKQLGRGQPFTYFAGSGYSAGATSLTWPIVLAPIWAVGARGHALVWAAFALCALLYASCAVLASRIVGALVARDAPTRDGEPSPLRVARAMVRLVAGMVVLGVAPFAWTSLSGMEVALTSALLLSTVALLVARTRTPSSTSAIPTADSAPPSASSSSRSLGPRPSRLLLACLVATSLARPEAAVIVAAICMAHAVAHRRDRRAALLWVAPLLAPLCWLLANRLLAGHWLPSTAIAKGQLFQPGFAWSAWWSALTTNAGKLVHGLFWDPASPLPQARLFAIAWLAGAVRIVLWARGQGASGRVAASVILVGPVAIAGMVLASSGLWTLHQYRYLAPVFPLLALPVGCAIAPLARWAWSRWASVAASVIVVGAIVWIGAPRHRVSAVTFAQAAADTNAQVVKLGRYLHAELPDATVMLHDAGALAYYGDTRVIDMLGLVTEDAAGVASHGPGARFEYLEGLAPELRPTHFAYYAGWLGAPDFVGAIVIDTPLGPPFARERIVGGKNMELSVASWDHVGTGERPLAPHAGWTMVDRVDVADLANERAHAWAGALGVRGFADSTAKWSFVARDIGDAGLVLDGGRTIRGGHEAFTIARDATRPARLIVRTGGAASASQETIGTPVTLHVVAGGAAIGDVVLPVPSGRMVEVELALPAGASSRIAVTASAPYRVFHWFVLQPD